MSARNNKYRRALPDNDTSALENYCIPIPTDKQFRAVWFGALLRNSYDFIWHIEQSGRRYTVAKWWNDYVISLYDLMKACEEGEPDCIDITPNDDRITWSPENPYSPDETVPEGYTFHPFTIVDSSIISTIISDFGFGYEIGDVYTDLTKIPTFTFSPAIVENLDNYPSFTLSGLIGTGLVRLYLLSIPNGGRALVQLDDAFDLLNLTLVDLNKDLISFPQETETPNVIEVPIETSGVHHITVTFFPNVDDTFLPVAFGGGLRKIEICGLGVIAMPSENCCPDQLTLTNKTNLLLEQVIGLLKGGATISFNGLTADSDSVISLPCIPEYYDMKGSDTGDDVQKRKDVLCLTVQAYVYGVMIKNLELLGLPQGSGESVWEFMVASPINWSKLQVNANPMTIALWLANSATYGIIADTLTCLMLEHLKGEITSYYPFRNSVPLAEDADPFTTAWYSILYYANHQKDNFTTFIEALAGNMELSLPEGWSCPCVPAAPVASDCGDISLVDYAGTGCTIEYISDCIWKFTQNTVSVRNGITARHFSFRDVNDVQLLVQNSDQPTIGSTAGVGGAMGTNACGGTTFDGYFFGGGFTAGNIDRVTWWQGGDANVTYYKVEAYTCP